jgi:energy-converting hydrogenase A subunit R
MRRLAVRQICIDCEGPLTKNDNALEISEYFVPQGERFFSLISRYDDFLADVAKRKGYKAGTTLSLILPFLKAYGATNQGIRDYSAGHLLLVPGAKETLSRLNKKMPSFIISTSYRPYIEALCDFVGFPVENTYSTFLDLDRYQISLKETRKLKALLQQILKLPFIDLSGVRKKEDLSPPTERTIRRLDELFEEEIPSMDCGRIMKETSPIGGMEKAKAVIDSLKDREISQVMYVGDSITDVEALKLVSERGGIGISFNGNQYALKAAQIACISPHTLPLEILGEVFVVGGKEGVLKLAKEWPQGLKENLRKKLTLISPDPRVEILTHENLERLTKESERMRKEVRGEAIGSLG